jgi:hypothetical protein
MYFPKNKIKTNLFTRGGEFIQLPTLRNYTGYYWSSHTGEFFTGKNPNDGPQIKLKKLDRSGVTEENFNPPFFGVEPKEYKNLLQINDNVDNNNAYSILKGKDVSMEKIIPLNEYPTPSESDYQLGGFMRYFTIRPNEAVYVETIKKHYDRLVARDPKYAVELARPFKIFWTLTGIKEEVQRANKNITELTQRRLNKKGLTQFLKGDYLQYYRESDPSTSVPTATPTPQPTRRPLTVVPAPTYTPPTPPTPSPSTGGGY